MLPVQPHTWIETLSPWIVGLNQTICDWHIGRVTLSTAKGLVFLRDASPAAQHDRMRALSSAYQRLWLDLVVMGLIIGGCTTVPTADPQALLIQPTHFRGWASYDQDLAECREQIRQALQAERPRVSPRIATFGPSGGLIDRDIEQKKATAKLQVCLEVRGYIVKSTTPGVPERYFKDLVECQEQVTHLPAPDIALARACMEARGYQVPW
jgi:hypothetical protein